MLLGLGALAVVVHGTLDRSLHLPGHQGLVWMALMVGARSASKYRWAATISGVGAAGMSVMPLFGFADPFIWLIYFLPGLIMDLGWSIGRPFQQHGWFLALLAGAAHASKPLVRVLIGAVLGWPYGSLLYGLAYPLALHIAFGLVGGLIGVGAIWAIRRKK
jgi:hypothetical protein